MAKCMICGKPVIVGKVVHTACMEVHAKEELKEVIKQREAERDKLLDMVRGDCRYCTHNGNPLDGPCKGCVHFAAKEFIEGDYWECKEVGG